MIKIPDHALGILTPTPLRLFLEPAAAASLTRRELIRDPCPSPGKSRREIRRRPQQPRAYPFFRPPPGIGIKFIIMESDSKFQERHIIHMLAIISHLLNVVLCHDLRDGEDAVAVLVAEGGVV